MAQVAPKLVAAELIDKVDIQQPVTINIGNSQAIAVIITNGFVVFGGIVHGMLFKSDSALLELVEELEIVESLPSLGGFYLLLFIGLKSLERVLRGAKRINGLGPVGARALQGHGWAEQEKNKGKTDKNLRPDRVHDKTRWTKFTLKSRHILSVIAAIASDPELTK